MAGTCTGDRQKFMYYFVFCANLSLNIICYPVYILTCIHAVFVVVFLSGFSGTSSAHCGRKATEG